MQHSAFREVSHRPWPLPDEPWIWSQTWNDLAFLHWRIAAEKLRPLVPNELAIDEFDGSAWVAVAPFVITGATLRYVPALPMVSDFPETNVRTYVRHGDKPGVWFFSLDADSQLAVLGGRLLFELPYVYANIVVHREGKRVDYELSRPAGTRFAASYEPAGPVQQSATGSLEHFLTERYCLYVASRGGRLHRAEIHHGPWPLQIAEAVVERNDMLSVHGIEVNGEPVVHFAERIDVAIWPLQPVVR